MRRLGLYALVLLLAACGANTGFRDRDVEITVRELTFFDRDSQRWGEEVDGVLVERVEGSGWADLGGLRPMDVILRLGETDVRGIQSFRRALREVKSSRPEHVVAVVLRGGRTHFHDLEPDWITRNDDD